ncbi:MAG: hypothetical protein R8G66_03855 [Cytophagales bacterium]|nr:hypothetical protein [Cytophagales bacterium]
MDRQSDYQQNVVLNCSIEKAFESLTTGIGDWWGKQDRLTDRIGITFKVSWSEPWYQFEVVTYNSPKEVTWKCTDANQIIEGLEGVQKEWVGTHLHWNLKSIDEANTSLHFRHEGLIKEFICYDFCFTTWDRFY